MGLHGENSQAIGRRVMVQQFGLSTSWFVHLYAALFSILFAAPLVLWALPASWYFEAEIAIPDFRQGENPLVGYTSAVYKAGAMTYTVQITPTSGVAMAKKCRGSDRYAYDVRPRKTRPMPLWRYVGVEDKPCELPAGEYTAYTCWDRKVLVFAKHYCVRSNVFRVIPREEV